VDISECLACTLHWYLNPTLAEAGTEVAMANDKTPTVVLSEYFSAYHESGHPQLAADEQRYAARPRQGR
jgi:hypothetical protein